MARGADGNITAVVFMECSVAGSSIDIIQELSAVLAPEQVAVDPALLDTYGQDWKGKKRNMVRISRSQ